MRPLKVIFIMAIVLGTKGNLFSQTCKDFNKSRYCWIQDAEDYKQYGKSRSAYVLIKKVYTYEVVLKDQKDYKIGVCAFPGYEPIQFKITDKETSKVVYDNSTDSYTPTVGFSVEDKPLTVIIEITILATEFKPKSDEDMRTCIGILILYKNIGKLGF